MSTMDQDYGNQRGWGLPRRPLLNHASTLRRIGAYIIDIILLWILTVFIFFVFFFLGFVTLEMFIDIENGALFSEFFNVPYLGLLGISSIIDLIYFTILESKKGKGATIGKRALGIKVVDGFGREVDFGPSFIRNIARLLWQIPCIGLLILIIDVFLIADNNQRIGDRIGNTYVIKKGSSASGHLDYDTYQGYPEQQWDQGRYSQHAPPSDKKKDESARLPSAEDRKPQTDSYRCPNCDNYSLIKNGDGGYRCMNCGYKR